MAPDGPLSVCVACSCRTVRTLIPEARKQMIEPPATMPREGGSDTTRWWFCLVMAHLRPDDPWRLPPPSLMAPNGNIAGPEWQYRVAPQASEYSLTANTDVATAKLPSNTNLARSTSVMGSV